MGKAMARPHHVSARHDEARRTRTEVPHVIRIIRFDQCARDHR
jgi:hypothetical protein